MRSTENYTIKLFTILQFAITASAVHTGFMAAHMGQSLGNLIILVIIVLGFLIYGKLSLTIFPLLITALSIIGYLLIPGNFTFGVPLLPFVGLFLVPKHYNLNELREKYGKIAKRISLINIILIYIICYVATVHFDLRLTNNISILFISLILINLLFFREPFFMTVLLGTILCLLFTPGSASKESIALFGIRTVGPGNRSAIFLIFFLINKEYITKFYSVLVKKKYFVKMCILMCLSMFGFYMFVDSFLHRPKMQNLYNDPRFLWFYPLLQLLINDGIITFFNEGSELLSFLGDGRTNPHNSFFYLLLSEYWVGLSKIVIYLLSILVIPISAWMAICGRASFDIFFLLGPLGIIFMSFFRVSYQERFRRFRWHSSKHYKEMNSPAENYRGSKP